MQHRNGHRESRPCDPLVYALGDRDVFRVAAEPRFPLPTALGFADYELLVVDAERGVVLELVGFIDGSRRARSNCATSASTSSQRLIPGTAFFALDGTTLSLSAAGTDDEQLLDLAEALVPVDA